MLQARKVVVEVVRPEKQHRKCARINRNAVGLKWVLVTKTAKSPHANAFNRSVVARPGRHLVTQAHMTAVMKIATHHATLGT